MSCLPKLYRFFLSIIISLHLLLALPVVAADHTGGISGKVLDADTLAPLSGVSVLLRGGGLIFRTTTNEQGEYQFSSLSPGEYYVWTRNYGDYISEKYDDIQCASRCSTKTGKPVLVLADQVTTEINFQLQIGGAISGVITDVETEVPLSDIEVDVFAFDGSWMASARSDAEGVYRVGGLPAEDYYVHSRPDEYLNQLYGRTDCLEPCDDWPVVTLGGVVSVTLGKTISGIDFSLYQGGTISGRLVAEDTGFPMEGIKILVQNDTGWYLEGVSTDANGEYRLSALASGRYFVLALANELYLDQIYGYGLSLGLQHERIGSGVDVTLGQNSAGIDFVLQKGGSISGRVTAADGHTPLSDVSLAAYDVMGNAVAGGVADSQGYYEVGGLPNGDYYLGFSSAEQDAYSYLYGAGVCVPRNQCDFSFATKIEVKAGKVTSGINIAWVASGSIAGNVRALDTSLSLSDAYVSVYQENSNRPVSYTLTDANGNYQIDGLAPGNYYLTAYTDEHYITRVYGGDDCVYTGCLTHLGTPVQVFSRQLAEGINFALKPGGVISGVVKAADTGLPLVSAKIGLLGPNGKYLNSGSTDEEGRYSITGLPPGNYFLYSRYDGYVMQSYGTEFSNNSDVVDEGGVDVVVGQPVTDINFALQPSDRSASISGRVIDSESGMALERVQINLYDDHGKLFTVSTDSDGRYHFYELQPGAYYVYAFTGLEHVAEIFGGGACTPSCDPANGKPILLDTDESVGDIDFQLRKGAAITGKVTTVDGKYPGSLYVTVIDAGGQLIGSVSVGAEGKYRVAGLPEGEYFVQVSPGFYFDWAGNSFYWQAEEGINHYSYQVYDNLECIQECETARGTLVSVKGMETVENIDFILRKGGVITGRVTASNTGEPLAYARIEIYDATGTFVMADTANSMGEYKVSGLPGGSYFVKASPIFNSSSYHWNYRLPHAEEYMAVAYGGLVCVNSCDVTRGAAVNVISGQTTVNINITLKPGGVITGFISDRFGKTLAFTRLSLFDAKGEWLGFDVWTDANGNYRISGLSEGNYYLLAQDMVGYQDQLYGGSICAADDCEITAGRQLRVRKGQTTYGTHFVVRNSTQELASSGGGGLTSGLIFLLIFCWIRWSNASLNRHIAS